MYKIIVTEELARLLKEKRIQSRITAKNLANEIQMNAAHLSKIENGLIKSIEPQLFHKLIKALFRNLSEEETLNKIYDSLKYWYSKDEIDKQLWFLNFDTIKRQIPLSSSLVSLLNTNMKDYNISRERLLIKMNSNEALTDNQRNNSSYEPNRWYLADSKHPYTKFIRIKMSLEQIDGILDGKIDKASFITVFCIAFYINKIIRYKDKIELTSDEYFRLNNDTEKQLAEYDFCTISYRNNRLKKVNTKEEYDYILSRYDKENIDTVQKIIDIFKYASDLDIKLTNQRLKEFLINLNWDIGFMLKIMSFDYKVNLDNFNKKKEFLVKLEQFIKDYQDSVKENYNNTLADY